MPRTRHDRFPLDRMDGLNLGLTVGVGALLMATSASLCVGGVLPLVLSLGASSSTAGTSHAAVAVAGLLVTAVMCGLIALFIVAIVASVWLLFRPSWFELSQGGLRMRWPLRRGFIPLARIRDVELLTADDRTARYGFGMRIGAGGLWGGFGYRTSSQGLLHMYISRTDYAVMIHVDDDRPWMITPRDPERFVATLRRLLEPVE